MEGTGHENHRTFRCPWQRLLLGIQSSKRKKLALHVRHQGLVVLYIRRVDATTNQQRGAADLIFWAAWRQVRVHWSQPSYCVLGMQSWLVGWLVSLVFADQPRHWIVVEFRNIKESFRSEGYWDQCVQKGLFVSLRQQKVERSPCGRDVNRSLFFSTEDQSFKLANSIILQWHNNSSTHKRRPKKILIMYHHDRLSP